ncbi:MAG: hypothetical protein MJK04_14080, partial [Psychrosphaera sp.]|nr:hypothetical protein [Psychrosphaera sp.]
MDVTGDGAVDIVGFGSSYVYVAANPLELPRAINKITNGIGGTTTLVYKPLTDTSVYTVEKGAVYPQQDVVNSMYVVVNNTISSGSSAKTYGSQSYTYTHQYAGAKVDVKGRGWLGFASATVTNKQTGITQTSHYHQNFPLTGRMSTEVTQSPSGIVLAKKVSNYTSVEGINEKTHQIQMQNAQQLYYSTGRHTYTLSRSYDYDHYSNVTKISDLGTDDEKNDKKNDNVYTCVAYKTAQKGEPFWYAFFPQAKKTVKTSEACDRLNVSQWNKASDLQFMTYDYDERLNLSGLSAWNDVKNKWITSTKKFDHYGNILSVTD